MPRGPAPGWRARKPPVLDDYILASVRAAGGKHDERGHYGTLCIRGLADKDEAAEFKKALFRCAHYLARNGIAPVSMHVDAPRREKGTWTISFRAVNKTMARKFVIDRYGPDPSKWPYDPRRRGGA